MAKIPVALTIEHAYRFTFGQFLSVLGLSWLPLFIVAVGSYFVLPLYFGGLRETLVNRDPSAFGPGAGLMFLLMLLMMVCFIMVYVAIARQVLGLRRGPAWFYFSLDAAFWRLLGAYLLIFLIVLTVTFAGAMLAGVLVASVGPGVAKGLAAVGAFFGIASLFLYPSLRLMFFVTPVAVAEGRHALRRSWALSSGNFWRIFVVLLAFLVPFYFVLIVIEVVVFASAASAIGTPPAQGSDPALMLNYLSELGARISALWPVLGPLVLLLYASIISLLISASSFAYRSLVPASEGIAAEFA